MSGETFKELDLERHARLLRRALGVSAPMAVCDGNGELVWSTQGWEAAGVAEGLTAVLETYEGAAGAAGGVGRVSLAGDQMLLCCPLHSKAANPIGGLAVLLDPSDRARPEEIEQALLDISAGIASEYRLNHEVAGLVDELSGRYEELNLVYELEGQAHALDQGSAGTQSLLESLVDFLDVDLAAFVLPNQPGASHAVRASRPIQNLDLVLTELRSNVFRFIAASRSPMVLNDSHDSRRQFLFVNLPYRLLACPVGRNSSVEGMLALVRHQDGRDFTNADRKLAAVISSQTEVILRNQQMLGDLRRFGSQMAGALIAAVEAKDPYTRGHSERVQAISVRLGRSSGLAASDVTDVSWGALLHDVGKIGIPDAILCKPGRLTEDEYTLVKIHPERSYEILRHVDYLGKNALEAARYHQEKFDGTGYPHGLRGTEIPVHARVLAVGDTYDAITSSRAYRAGQSHEVAMAEISRVAGSQLDPQYVRVFEKMCQEGVRWLEEIRAGRIDLEDV